jgi:hypothetical protein
VVTLRKELPSASASLLYFGKNLDTPLNAALSFALLKLNGGLPWL